MMVHVLGVVAIVGFGATASAQEYSLSLQGSTNIVDTSDGSVTISLDVIGDIFEPDGAEYMLWGWFGLETRGDAIVEHIQWIPADWSEFNIDGGYLGQGVHGQIEFGQWESVGWTPHEGSAVGSRIGSFEITLAQQSLSNGQFSAGLVHGERYSLSTINVDTGASYYSTRDSLVLEGYSVGIVPTPSTALILIGAGGLGIRRKR